MFSYSKNYYKIYDSASLRIRRFVREKLRLTPRAKPLFRYLNSLPMGAQILDAGCGAGGFLELMELENPNIASLGIDIGFPSSFAAKAPFIRGSVTSLPFADNSFDLVTCSHVIEHLTNPIPCLRELLRVCKPGCMVYIEAPSPRSTWIPFFNIFWDDPTHVRPYSQIALRRLLEIAGTDRIQSGIKHSLPAVLFGLPYLPIGMLLGDRQTKAMFAIYTFGFSVWAAGIKQKSA